MEHLEAIAPSWPSCKYARLAGSSECYHLQHHSLIMSRSCLRLLRFNIAYIVYPRQASTCANLPCPMRIHHTADPFPITSGDTCSWECGQVAAASIAGVEVVYHAFDEAGAALVQGAIMVGGP